MRLLNNIIARRVLAEYSKDMGNYFDYIKGNEEEMHNETLMIVENAPFYSKIKMLIKGCI